MRGQVSVHHKSVGAGEWCEDRLVKTMKVATHWGLVLEQVSVNHESDGAGEWYDDRLV